MSENWEIIIFGGFIIINLVLGLYFSKGVKTIREYAIGDIDFIIFYSKHRKRVYIPKLNS